LQRAVALDPTSPVAHFRLSALYRQEGRSAEAQHEVEEYQKYKTMKEKLDVIFREMRLEPWRKDQDESEQDHPQ